MAWPSLAVQEAYIRQQAPVYGLDPNVAVRIAQGEGLNLAAARNNFNELSGGGGVGPFQLTPADMGGGLGTTFANVFGPADSSNWRDQIDFSLATAANDGNWNQWVAARKLGLVDSGFVEDNSVTQANADAVLSGFSPARAGDFGGEASFVPLPPSRPEFASMPEGLNPEPDSTFAIGPAGGGLGDSGFNGVPGENQDWSTFAIGPAGGGIQQESVAPVSSPNIEGPFSPVGYFQPGADTGSNAGFIPSSGGETTQLPVLEVGGSNISGNFADQPNQLPLLASGVANTGGAAAGMGFFDFTGGGTPVTAGTQTGADLGFIGSSGFQENAQTPPPVGDANLPLMASGATQSDMAAGLQDQSGNLGSMGGSTTPGGGGGGGGGSSPTQGLPGPLQAILGGKAPGSDIQAPQGGGGGSGGGQPIMITNAEKVAQKAGTDIGKAVGEAAKTIGQSAQQLGQVEAQDTQSLIQQIQASTKGAENTAQTGFLDFSSWFRRGVVGFLGIVLLAAAAFYFTRGGGGGAQHARA